MDKQTDINPQEKHASRRKFLLGAAKAAPVVTSIASLPVWANGVSISGNLSGNVSGTYEVAKFNGCSPGYYKAKGGNISHQSNRLPSTEYQRTFGDLFGYEGLSLATGETVKELLKDSSTYEVERRLVAHYYNAFDSGHSGNPENFPYSQQEIVDFYNLIGTSVTVSEANTILINLEHFGMPDYSGDGGC
jgi:hypothetical protein